MTLSVCLIVKNEEDVIARCLGCVRKFADEIIVADTGSTDGTVETIKKFTEKLYFFPWNDDFSAARNFVLDQATCDYVMWLDADDVVTDENIAIIKQLLCSPDFDMAFLKYATGFDGERPNFIYYRERIFRRSKHYRFCGAVHEAVVPEGKIVYSDAVIAHKKMHAGDPLRNLHILQKQILRGEKLNSREKFYYGRELLFHGMYPESCAVLEDFLHGDGWVENKIEACLNLYRAYRAMGKDERAVNALLRSFMFAPPRSEACCILGDRFLNDGNLSAAEYWYRQALAVGDDGKSGGFVNTDYTGFVPLMQLCVICDRRGDLLQANEYNERAGTIKPDSPAYLYNKQYFNDRLS